MTSTDSNTITVRLESGESETVTASDQGIEIIYDAGLIEEEDRFLGEWMKRSYPPGSSYYTAPLWMCLAWWWPNCFTTAFFWLKGKFCKPDYTVPDNAYDVQSGTEPLREIG